MTETATAAQSNPGPRVSDDELSESPDGVGSVDTIYDCEAGNGILVRLTREVDLDELLLHLVDHFGDVDGEDSGWYLDEPTTLPGYPYLDRGRQAQVGWFRKQVCADGDHNWDMAFVSDEKPQGNKARGAFLGVFLG
jgi:hypothetical protein